MLEIASDIAARAGIGLRARHLDEAASQAPPVSFLEIHAENYLGGGPALRKVERLRADHAMSVHGVGLSLGSADGIDAHHLGRVAALVDRLQPQLVSEHLAWSVVGGAYLNDLLPLPYTAESLAVVARNIDCVQTVLKRSLLIENPSSYVAFVQTTMTEPEFLAALVARTGCRLLCDVNNIFVSGSNVGFDPAAYLDALPAAAVAEIHLAGHACNDADGETILIDDHGSRVCDAVWSLYRRAVARFGLRPTLIEWDTDVPALDVLLEEAARADREAAAAAAGQAT
ncbi:MAG TPA: DUF692 domain-containing protein [Vineibacter sp.]|nr:DUF692 domain-containing protein [Vineibacter sp.]